MAMSQVYISASVIHVDTTSASKVIMLPIASTIVGTSITIRDTTGNSQNYPIFVSTQAYDTLDKFKNTIVLSNAYESVRVAAHGNSNWAIVQDYTQTYLIQNPSWIAGGIGTDNTNSLQYSSDGSNWSNTTVAQFTTNSINAIANNNSNLWVFGASAGTLFPPGVTNSTTSLFYSQDGSNFQPDIGVITVKNGVNGITYGNGTWVAAASNTFAQGTIVYSQNPTLGWSTITTGGFTQLNGTGVAYANNLFVATGSSRTKGGSIQHSTDGSNWYNALTGGFSTVGAYRGNAVANDGFMWVAAGAAATTTGTLLNSIDGINWSNANTGGFPVIAPPTPPVGQETFVAAGKGGSGGSLLWSTDGSNWNNAISGAFDLTGCGVAYNGSNLWVAVGSGASALDSILHSTDGSNWLPSVTGGFSNFTGNAVTYANNLWIATGTGTSEVNSILYSGDGSNWSNADTGGFGPVIFCGLGIAYGNGLWVAAGTTGMPGFGYSLQWSVNGSNWFAASSGEFLGQANAVAYNGSNLWMSVGVGTTANDSIRYSPDGSNWYSISSGGFYKPGMPATCRGFSVSYANNLWLATGASSNPQGTIQYSGDGYFWSNVNSGGFKSPSLLYTTLGGVTYGSNLGLWIAVGNSNSSTETAIQYSPDGSNWSPAASGSFSAYGFGVAVGLVLPPPVSQALFVAAGLGTSPLTSLSYSTDGNTWNPIKSGGFSSNEGHAVGYNGSNLWVAVGQGSGTNAILYSGDASNWSNVNTGGFGSNTGNGVAYGNGLWVATGLASTALNTIQYSGDGRNWSNVLNGGFDNGGGLFVGFSVAYGNGIFVAAGAGTGSTNSLQWSSDGSNWNNILSGGPVNWQGVDLYYGFGVAYNGSNLWVATALGGDVTTESLLYSYDGSNWGFASSGGFSINYTTPGFHYCIGYTVSYGNGIWVAIGENPGGGASIQWSSDGFNWNNAVSGGFGCSNWNGSAGVNYNSNLGLWVATATTSAPSIQYSSDGSNWSNATSGYFPVSGYGVASGLVVPQVLQGIFVAAGNGGGISQEGSLLYSTDGSNWLPANSGGFSYFGLYLGRNVGYNGTNLWIAVGQAAGTGSILYSSDGSNWSNSISGGFDAGGIGVGYGNGLWVTTGTAYYAGANTILYSGDGSNWSNSISGGFDDGAGQYIGNGVAYGNGLWVAAGKGLSPQSSLQYSGDGCNWSNADTGGFTFGGSIYIGNKVAYNGTSLFPWVAVGLGDNPTGSILISPDGSNWSVVNTGGFDDGAGTYIGYSVAYGNGLWVAVGESSTPEGTLQYSGDGLNWSNATSGGFNSGAGISIGAVSYSSYLGIWVAVAAYATTTMLYSTDGMNWSDAASGYITSQRYGVGSGTIGSAPPPPPPVHISSIWVAAGQNPSLLYSLDSSNWSNANGTFATAGKGLAFNNSNLWISVGDSPTQAGTILASITGYNWSNTFTGGFTQYSSNIPASGNGVAYLSNTDTWIATGTGSDASGTILISLDGFNWNNILTGGFNAPYSSNRNVGNAIANDTINTWVATGTGDTSAGSILNSIDGLNWSPAFTDGFPVISNVVWEGRGVTYTDPILLAVGKDNISSATIQTSTDGSNWSNSASGGFPLFGTSVGYNSTGMMWVATGSNTQSTGTLLYSGDSSNWSNAQSGGFTDNSGIFQANAIAYDGFFNWVAAGIGYNSTNSLLYSGDGQNWSNINTGGFSTTATGVAVSVKNIQVSTLQYWVAAGASTTPEGTLQYSYDGLSWSNANTGGFDDGAGLNRGYSVTFNQSTATWLAAGIGSNELASLLYSSNGSNWSNANTGGFSNAAIDILYGNGKFPVILPLWVAVGGTGGTGTIVYSLDSSNWSNAVTGGFAVQGNGVAFDGMSTWVLAGFGTTATNTLLYSGDGSNFSNVLNGGFDDSFGDYIGNGVGHNGSNLWVAAGLGSNDAGSLLYSGDAQNWSNATTGGFNSGPGGVYEGFNVAFGSGINQWIAVGLGGAGGTTSILYSTDGSNWNNIIIGDFTGPQGGKAAVYGSNLWIAAGSGLNASNTLLYSHDGSNFYDILSGGFNDSLGTYQGNGVAYNGSNLWVAVGQGSNSVTTIQYTGDGSNWSDVTTGGFDDGAGTYIGYSVTYGNGIWSATGLGIDSVTSIQWSTDGSNWLNSISDTGGAAQYNGVAFGNQRLTFPSTVVLATGIGYSSTTTIQYSFDSSNWLPILSGGFPNTMTGFTGLGLGYDGMDGWIATGQGTETTNTILYSGNGFEWSNANTGGFTDLQGNNVDYGTIIIGAIPLTGWVAVGKSLTQDGSIQYSGDGSNWSNSISGGFVSNQGNDVIFNGSDLWVATGVGSTPQETLKYSGDGLNWSDATSGGFTSLQGSRVAYHNGVWIATGLETGTLNTSILYSSDGSNWSESLSGGFNNGGGIAFGQTVNTKADILWVATGIDSNTQGTIRYSSDAINWYKAKTGGFTSGYGYAVANDGSSQWIATGEGTGQNSILRSTDGSNWTNVTSGSIQGVGRAVAYALVDNLYPTWVVTGTATPATPAIVYSLNNGLDWTLASYNTFATTVYGVTYNTNSLIWIATGDAANAVNSIQYSGDVANWSNIISGGFVDITERAATGNGIAYNGSNLWICVGVGTSSDTSILYSVDGAFWLNANTGGFDDGAGSYIGNAVAYGDGLWVVVGKGTNSILKSSDGSNWSSAASGFAGGVGYGISYNGSNRWTAVGQGITQEESILISADGNTWSPVTSGGFIGHGNAVAYGFIPTTPPSIYVVIANSLYPYYSFDAINWTQSLSGFSAYGGGKSVAYNGINTWVAGGFAPFGNAYIGQFLISPDGSNWSYVFYPNVTSIGGISYGKGLFIATTNTPVSSAESILYSKDGYNWFPANSGGFDYDYGISDGLNVAYGNGLFVAVGYAISGITSHTILYSQDGSNWLTSVSVEGMDRYFCRGIAYNGSNLWVAVGGSSNSPLKSINYSHDGSNWYDIVSGGFSSPNINNPYTGLGVTYGNGIWVAVGASYTPVGSIQYSGDGSNWSNALSGGFDIQYGFSDGYSVTFNIYTSQFAATSPGQVGPNGVIYSGDGMNWSNTNFTGSNPLGIAAGLAQIPLPPPSGPIAEAFSVAYGNNQWVATGKGTAASNTILYSGDGSNWSNTSQGGFDLNSGYGVTYANKEWVAVGKATTAMSTIQKSTDGISWTASETGGFNSGTGYAISFRQWRGSSN
jgi:hypothetical protein